MERRAGEGISRGYSSTHAFVQPTPGLFHTLRSLSAWLLDDVLQQDGLAYEHRVNKRNADKVQHIRCMENVGAACLIHDNACQFGSN